MGSFNGIVVTERHQRPSMNGLTALRAIVLRDGQFLDLPADQVSSVMLFDARANTSPSSILEASTGLVTDAAASSAVWRWTNDGGAFPAAASFARSDDQSASGIFRTGTGQFAVFLNGLDDVSSVDSEGSVIGSVAQLSGSPAGKFIDVWTVKMEAGADWVTVINETDFFQGNSVVLTTPLIFNSRTQLTNKKVKIGSKEKLKVTTEVTIENKDIDESIKRTLCDGLITSASMEIKKHNVDTSLPSWVTVSGHADTEGLVDVTSDSTFLFLFDTDVLTSGSIANLGAGRGTYSVQVKYGILDEEILSPEMFFVIH